MKGRGPKSSVCPSKPGKPNLFGGISRDFAGISRRCPKSLRRKGLCTVLNSRPDPCSVDFGRETPKFRFDLASWVFGGCCPPIFSKEKGPKNPPRNSPGTLFRKIPLGFLQKPSLDSFRSLYLCSPNGPNGTLRPFPAQSKALEEWLQWGSSEEAEAEASADELGSLAESLEQRRQASHLSLASPEVRGP